MNQSRRGYLWSCHGCSAHMLSEYPPPRDDRAVRHCPKCARAQRERELQWGDFQKGDRVKPKYAKYLSSPFETLVVSSVSGDKVKVFPLGSPDKMTEVSAHELSFSGYLFRG